MNANTRGENENAVRKTACGAEVLIANNRRMKVKTEFKSWMGSASHCNVLSHLFIMPIPFPYELRTQI